VVYAHFGARPDRTLPRAAAPVWRHWRGSRGQDLLTRQRALDYALYLPEDILVKTDRASMAHSIEARSPFLDYRLVELAARLPASTLINGHEGKLPLRGLAQRLLPAPVQRSVKRGFGVPIGAWIRQPSGKAFIQERLLSEEARRRELWDMGGTQQLLDLHQAGRGRDFGMLLWRLLVLDAWARHYVDGPISAQNPYPIVNQAA
jgi:asparagine synthase (glutamine-hydrolysing)